MAKIISIREGRVLASKNVFNDFNQSLRYILEQSKNFSKEDEKKLGNYPNLTDWLRKKISQEIISRKMLSSDVFLCGIYIADIMGKTDKNLKMYAVDFVEQWSKTSDPVHLKKGGDFCFILCGAFPKKFIRRSVKIDYYRKMGVNFYQNYYGLTGKPIGYYMGANFELMQEIVRTIFH